MSVLARRQAVPVFLAFAFAYFFSTLLRAITATLSPTLTAESVRRARTLRRMLSAEVATTVGGGHCGIAASLFIKFASQKTAAAEEAFTAGDFETHRKLSESARMDILYAREHAAKEAASRPPTLARSPWFEPESPK